MAERPPTNHDDLEHALARVESSIGAAEMHGLLCGGLCAPSAPDESAWLPEVLGESEPGDPHHQAARELVVGCREHARRQLASQGFGFQPLLPGESETLRRRSDALACWCSGFLFGLGMGGEGVTSGLSDEAREVLEDFTEFTRLQAEPGAGDREERAFMELVEYVRMGVLLVREELLGPVPGGVSPMRH